VFDRPDNKSVRTIFANEPSFTIDNLGQYQYGSIIVMETWRALQDAAGNPVLDERGRFQKDPAATPTLFVMRKERGFGADYKENRTGEWEYVAYRPDGSHQTPPQNSFSCAMCHLQVGQSKDWVFRGGLHFNKASGAIPYGTIQHYRFVPRVISTPPGSTITIYNDDVVEHTFADVADDRWGPIRIKPGSSITITFPNQTGEFNFRCTLHANMTGKVIVE
jgi:plastocyanin